MIDRALGMPLSMALRLFEGRECIVETTRPPRRPDKQGNARVVRAEENGGAVRLTVSPFEDTLEEKDHA